jgi:hypothetical protein
MAIFALRAGEQNLSAFDCRPIKRPNIFQSFYTARVVLGG